MSLEVFQQALANLVRSPELCRRVRDRPDDVLAQFDLSPREKRRLVAVVAQPGMSTNCSLYRQNRVTPLYTMLHLTCLGLEDSLQAELDAYWSSEEFLDLQFSLEITRFAHFLGRRLRESTSHRPWVEDLLDFELAVNELEFLPRTQILRDLKPSTGPKRLHPLTRLARFSWDATVLFEAFARAGRVDCEVPGGTFFYLLSRIDGTLQVLPLDAATGEVLELVGRGLPPGVNLAARAETLSSAGILI